MIPMEHVGKGLIVSVRLTDVETAGDIEVQVSLHDDWHETLPDQVQLALGCHEVISSSWCASVSCVREKDGPLWKGRVTVSGDHPRLLEVTRIDTPTAPSLPDLLPDASLHLEPARPGEWITGQVASDELECRRQQREQFFGGPLCAPEATHESPTFAAVMVTDNVHLTVAHRVPGLAVIPLQQSTLGIDIVGALNEVLPQLGYQCVVDPTQWLGMIQQRNPAAIVHASAIKARSPEEAQAHVAESTHQLLDITALRRGARPRLLGGVLLTKDATGRMTGVRMWVESRGYTGNLLGGFVSGEDPHGLIDIWGGTRANPRTQLWLSMYADALADARSDYRFFRTFNLLEAIASEVVPRGGIVADVQGHPLLQSDGNPYTTKQVRGRIFELLKRVANVSQTLLSSFATPSQAPNPAQSESFATTQGDLWDELDVWVKIRNEVAHHGTWRLPTGEPANVRRQNLEKRIERLTSTVGGNAAGLDGLLMTISRACDTTLYQAVAGRL